MVLYRKRDFYFSGTSKLAGLGLGLGLEPSGLGLGLETSGLGLGLGLEQVLAVLINCLLLTFNSID